MKYLFFIFIGGFISALILLLIFTGDTSLIWKWYI